MISQEKAAFISVATAQKSDIFSILNIQNDCRLSQWTVIEYEEEIAREDSVLLVVKLNDETIGFVAARISESELDILNFGVFTRFRRRGIGNAVFSKLLSQFVPASVKTVWLEVRESNVEAMRFYQKRGFAPIQVRKNFYRQPAENALVMKMDVQKIGR